VIPPSLRARVQRGGALLSGMMVPNIAAFLAWGFITALVAPGGWWPNPAIAVLISPMLLTLLPILVGFSGGRLVHGNRGGVVGAVATMGAIAGSDAPMLIGAMLLGPLGGLTLRWFDRASAGRFPPALQMLVANFSAGLLGALLAVVGLVAIAPAVHTATDTLAAAARTLTTAGLLPLAAVVIEPAKVLFLNNAINHGVLAPLGVAQAHTDGRSIFFLLETNPGPGLGLLLAFWRYGGAAVRQSAPGAIVVHALGGIHEIYFPYVLMQPLTLLALIAGGFAADVAFVASGAGLVATPSPGSIVAQLALAPRGGAGPVLLGIGIGTLCSFLVAVALVRLIGAGETADDLAQAQGRTRAMKPAAFMPVQPTLALADARVDRTIVFACDAGLGSSVIGATVLQRKLKECGLAATVTHAAIGDLQPSAQIIVVHTSLEERVRRQVPGAVVYVVDDFVHSPTYDRLIDDVRRSVRA
jgi:mannitol PTS system EIICBA or EIICB component